MLECYRIDVLDGINVSKTDGPCKCIIYHYLHFVYINFRFQAKVCNGSYDAKSYENEYAKSYEF